MLKTLTLLLPALIPSWRFFDTISASPRIEFTVLETSESTPQNWQEFRPRPQYLPMSSMLKRLFWNPRWNETLFLASCAERLQENPTEHSIREIVTRITTELGQSVLQAGYLQFRLLFVSCPGVKLQRDIMFISSVYPVLGNSS